MSLIWMEGFDHEAGTTDLQNGIIVPTMRPGVAAGSGQTFNAALSNSGTRWDVGAYLTATGGGSYIEIGGFVIPFSSATFTQGYFGCALQIPSGGVAYFSFYDIANGIEQISISIFSTGSFSVYRGGISNVNYSGQTPLFSGFITNFSVNWNYIEMYLLVDPASGAFTLMCNGRQIATQTGLNTSNNINSANNQTVPASGVFSGMGCGALNSVAVGFDDMYFNDTTGSAPYNTFLGDVRIQTAKVNGSGTYAQFTPLTGTNWSQVSDSVVDGDASYNYSNTIGQKDTFVTTGGYINSTVFGVQIVAYARKDDAINRQLANYIISNGTEVAGSSNYLASSYAYNKDVFVTDPHTSAPWTAGGVNSLEIGYKLIS
jgi:hypothetical protein